MKRLITLFATLMTVLAMPQKMMAYDFSSVSPSGHTLYYNVVNGCAQVTCQNTGIIAYSNLIGSLIIPDSVSYSNTMIPVTSVNDTAFRHCHDLTHVNIPATVTTIGNRAFQSCIGLNIVYMWGVISIGNSAFYNCSSLYYVYIPSTTTSIGQYAFARCRNLIEIDIPNSVTSIGCYAFECDTSLQLIYNMQGITTISEGLFWGCSNIRTRNIPSSITSIGNYAFYRCSKLNEVTFHSGISSIGDFAFGECDSLTSIALPNTVNHIGAGAFRRCTGFTSISIPDSVQSVGAWAFDSCTNLTTAAIGCDTIQVGTFNDCVNLSSITLGQNVKHIVYHAFSGCVNLDSVFLLPEVAPSINYGSFDENTDRVFYIPCGSYDLYFNYSPRIEPDAGITITVLSDNEMQGTVNIVQTRGVDVSCDSTSMIQAIPNEGFFFSHWSDSDTTNPRTIILTHDTSLTAYFTEVSFDCDSISLPYTADFTQCWTAEGAVVIDPNHVSMISVGQKITSPWMESYPGKTFLHWDQQREGTLDYNSEQFTITIESETGVIASWLEYAADWSLTSTFTSPGGRIRVTFEYTGSNPVPSYQITGVNLYQYEIENTIEAPVIAHVGDTVMFTAHATLQNGETPDYYEWNMYDSFGNWMNEDDSARTIISRTDSTLLVVWNSHGRYQVSCDINKYNVYNDADGSYSAYAHAYQNINIVDHDFFEADSIYYISAAMDTVIGCHPDLHVANLPESVTVIFDSAFFNLSNLSIIELPTSLHTIGNMAFAWNQGISEITIPQNVTFVGDNAFWWDTNLTTVNFNATNCQTMSPSTDNNGNYWPVFIGCDNITTINIGENVTRIPDRAFSYCNGLHGTLTIPDAVTYIGRSAFYHWINDWDWDNGSSWDTLSIVLGAGLTEIGDYAFGCPRAHITSVISHNPVPPIIGEQTFYRYEPEYTPRLQVPCGSATAYRNAQHWSRIEEIIEDCDGIEDAENDARTPAILSDNGIITVVGATELVSVYDMMGRLVSAYMPTDFRCTIVVPHSGVYMVKIGDCPARKIVVIK